MERRVQRGAHAQLKAREKWEPAKAKAATRGCADSRERGPNVQKRKTGETPIVGKD